MATPELVQITLTSPESVIWEGEALSLTSENSEGLFDLFPDHARFMTLLENTDVVIQLPDGADEVFPLEKAVLFFEDAVAKIYLHKHIKPKPKSGRLPIKKA